MENVLYEYSFDFKDFLSNLIPMIVGLVFLGISIMLVLNKEKKVVPHKDEKIIDVNNNLFKIIGFIVGPFCIGIALLCMGGMLSKHFALVELLENENAHVVEGYVENYHPLPWHEKGLESFEINGVFFEYSEAIVMNGYNDTVDCGGVVTHEGQYLKIKYIPQTMEGGDDWNVILYIAEVEPPA